MVRTKDCATDCAELKKRLTQILVLRFALKIANEAAEGKRGEEKFYLYPGLCPGLICYALSGLEEARPFVAWPWHEENPPAGAPGANIEEKSTLGRRGAGLNFA